MVRTAEVRVETERDLKKVLKSMSLWEDFRSTTLRCEFCNSLITWNNIASLFSVNGRFAAGCDNYVCYKYFLGLCVKPPTQNIEAS
jgi:hypothetical protein